MSKGLETIKTLRTVNQREFDNDKNVNKSLDIIEKDLQRLESIDNAKPNEALKNLDKVIDYLNNVYDYKEIKEEIRKDINYIKQALLRLDSLDAAMDLLPNRFSCINNREIIVMRTEMYEKYCEQEKVLEILKEKPLSLLVFKTFKIYDKEGILELDYQYFVDCHKAISEELDEEAQEQVAIEEEFELLKRWIG